MRFNRLHISAFGKYTHEDVTFTEGINVIYGNNGSGKSTLHSYLKGMLFGLERGRGKAAHSDEYSRYFPWDSQAPFGGSLEFSDGEDTYLLERCFDTRKRSLALRRASSGALISQDQSSLDALLGQMTEETYRNTISIEQLKVSAGETLGAELKNHLSSIALSGTSTLDVSHSLEALKAQKKQLKKQLDPEAPARYEALFAEICREEDRLKGMSGKPEQYEANVKELNETLEKTQQTYEALEQELTEKQAQLETHPMAKLPSPEIYQDRIQDAYAAYRLAREENERHQTRRGRKKDLVIGSITVILFTLLGLFTLFYDKLPFANMPLPFKKYPLPAIFFILAGISFLVTLMIVIRARKDNSDSESMAQETENFLKSEFLSHLGTDEITEEHFEALNASLDSYFTLTRDIANDRILAEENLKETVALQSQLQEAQEVLAGCRKEVWEFEQTCQRLSNMEDEKTELEKIMNRNQKTEEKIRAVSLAEETISELSAKLHEVFSPVLNQRVSEIVCAITDGVYDNLHIDESLSITLQQGGRSIPLGSLSRGTIEQVYLALRISAVEILYPDQDLPILLDDTFAYYDDTRLHNTLKWLAEHYSGQVLLFTCHKREAAYLSRIDAPFHLISLD